MKKYWKVLGIFTILIIIALFKGNSTYASSMELTQINPIYEDVLSEEEKQNVLQSLQEDEKIETYEYKAPTYNNIQCTTYDSLVKTTQDNLVKRNTAFTVFYKINSTNTDFLYTLMNDALVKEFTSSSDTGDYLRYSVAAWSIDVVRYKDSGGYREYALDCSAQYFTTYKQEQELNNVIKKYLDTYSWKQKSDYEIIYDFNNYICENAEYDYDGLHDSSNLIKYSAYAALVKHKAVCQGYAALYYKLLKECEVNVIVVSSRNLNHAWNAVKYNGLWYSVDTTWNDTGSPYHDYFMKSISDFNHGSLSDANPAITAYKYATTSIDIEANRFSINKATAKVNTSYSDIISGKSPSIELTFTGTKLKSGVDYKITKTEKGSNEAIITVKGLGKFKGTKSIIVTEKKDLSKVKAIVDTTNRIYTGKAITTSITLKDGSTSLRRGTDYTLTYKNNIKPGKATVTIVGKGKYDGKITKSFIILPKRVIGFSAIAQTNSSITIKWARDTNVTGYEVYMSTSKNGTYKKVTTITKNSTTSYRQAGLTAGKTYYFKVKAYKTVSGTKKYGAYSLVLETTTKTNTPTISKLTSANKKATIEWKKVSGATGYEVYMSTNKNGTYNKIKTVTNGDTTKFTKSGLTKNKTYYFKIKTYRTVNGEKVYSPYSSIKSIKVK